MATPDTLNLTTFSRSGHKFKLNKSLSSDIQPVLALQGVNAVLRKAISATSVGMTVTQPSADEISMAQTATSMGIPGTTEDYVLDFGWRDVQDPFFGPVRTRARWVALTELKGTDVLSEEVDWALGSRKQDEEAQEPRLIYAEGVSDEGGWNARHIWGFEVVDGHRRFTRRTRTEGKNGEIERVRMVYDFES